MLRLISIAVVAAVAALAVSALFVVMGWWCGLMFRMAGGELWGLIPALAPMFFVAFAARLMVANSKRETR